jgi:hypothetical protein
MGAVEENPYDSPVTELGALCEDVLQLANVDGVALAVMSRSRRTRDLVYATDALAQQIDELQFTLGEGPCLDAFTDRESRLLVDLRDRKVTATWPIFTTEAFELGVRAAFAFPVPAATGDPVAVLELLRRTRGPLTRPEHAAAIAIADRAGTVITQKWQHYLATHDHPAEVPARYPEVFSRENVYLASGMVAVQLALPANDALDRLRAFSYQQARPITEVADDVVARRITMRADPT